MSAAKKLNDQAHEENFNFEPLRDYQWQYRVLVVDDEREIADSYRSILRPDTGNVVSIRSSRSQSSGEQAPVQNDFPFEVTLAHNYEEALGAVKLAMQNGKPFSMGFFDVRLGGGKDGFDLVKAVHELDPTLLAVFVTAYNDRSIESIHDYLGQDRADHWDYINKPFTESEIMQKARNFVSLWNLKKEKEIRDGQMAEIHKKVLSSERLNSVSAMARGVGHEFGNLLMQITGQADVNRNKDEEKMRDAFDVILSACERASDILDRFNDLSHPSEAHPPKESYFVDEILDEALSLMSHQFKTGSTKICRIKNDHVAAQVSSTAILQVFVNLSINALHAMGSGGQIDYSVVSEGDSVLVKIRDYGPGIKKEDLSKVTEAFFTTKGSGGTGLGLAICKEIIEIEHQGEFKLQNHETKGLEISIKIPCKEVK